MLEARDRSPGLPGDDAGSCAKPWCPLVPSGPSCDNFLHNFEGIWSLLKRAMANFAAADLDGLVHIVKRKLKKIQYRPHLIDGCLPATGQAIEPW